jgi:GNAT superfamily N-acetyltransferase
MTTRTLAIADHAALNELAALGETEGFRFIRRFVDDLTAGRVRPNNRCEFFLGVTAGDQLVGIGGVTPDPYLQDPLVGRLRHLYVRPGHRGAGVGRLLVAQLEARAEHCYAFLRLRTDTAAAARFYEQLGYEPVTTATATHQRALRLTSARQQPNER